MAYQDALFQLGMDLTRSSTAQEEDFGETAQVAHVVADEARRTDKRKAQSVERSRSRVGGNHLTVDLFGGQGLNDLEHIEDTLRRCARLAGGEPLHVHLHRFTPNGGVSGVVVLADSHISFHSWPEAGYAALDVFMRGKTETQACVDLLQAAFEPRKVAVKAARRDGSGNSAVRKGADAEALAIAQGETAVRVSRQRSKVRRAA